MAIGSDPEIGVKFTRWGDMDAASQQEWFNHIRTVWGTDLLGGYATLEEWKQHERHN